MKTPLVVIVVPPPPPSSPPLSYADHHPIYSLLFVSVSMPSSRSLVHETREGLSRSPFIPATVRLVVSWSKLFCPVSPGRAMRYLWVSFGALCRSRHYTGEREVLPSIPSALFLRSEQARSVVHRDVRLQPTATTTTTTMTAAAATRVYECSASGIVFLHLLFSRKRILTLRTLNRKSKRSWREKRRAR